MPGSTRQLLELQEIGYKPALNKHGAGQARNDRGFNVPAVYTKIETVSRHF